jgi:Family of unknown function (DUF6308)
MRLDLLDVVLEPAAEPNLSSYFASKAGRWFEALGGGGDRPATRFVITAEDLVAVQMLSVQVPAEVAARLLEGDLGRRITAQLIEIDAAAELGTPAAAALVEDGSAAHRAWSLLDAEPKVGWVIAGKIMARKRPHLLPVYDDVVRCHFGGPARFWVSLHNRLAQDDEHLRLALAGLRTRAAVPPTVSTLRVLDVLLWMRHQAEHREHARKQCPGFGTVSLPAAG